jgi:threonine dehydratase
MSVTVADVLAARRRLDGRILRTPLRRSTLDGREVHLKLESLQVTHSFKIRGAYNAALRHQERHPGGAPPLVTASAGNHGRALAYAAEQLGLRATVFTMRTAARTKIDAIRAHGAELRLEPDYDATEPAAKRFAAETGGVYLSPYSDPDVIAGAATVGLEILEDLPDVETIVVPLGGGGLIAGVAIAARAIAPRVAIVGVEADASPVFTTSLAAGRITEVTVRATIADGLAGNLDPNSVTFDLVRRLVDRVVTVSDAEMAHAIRALVAGEHLIAEGAGAAGLAGVLSGKAQAKGRTAVVISGGNIDAERLTEILSGTRDEG